MSDFKVFQLNKKAKFLNKAKDNKSKRNEESRTGLFILRIQKNIRAFLTFRRQDRHQNPLFLRNLQAPNNHKIYNNILSTISTQPKIVRNRFIHIFLDELVRNNHASLNNLSEIIHIIAQEYANRITSKQYTFLLDLFSTHFTQQIMTELFHNSVAFKKALKSKIKPCVLDLCDFLVQFKDINFINELMKTYYQKQQNAMQIQEKSPYSQLFEELPQKFSQERLLKSYYNAIFLFKLIHKQKISINFIIRLLSSLLSSMKNYYTKFLLMKYHIEYSMYASKEFHEEIMQLFKQKKEWQEYEDNLYHLKDIIPLMLNQFILNHSPQKNEIQSPQDSLTEDIIKILIEYTKINQSIILMDINQKEFFTLIQKLASKSIFLSKEQEEIKNYSLFITIMLLQKYLQNLNDLKFMQMFQYQKQKLKNVIKDYLIRFMKSFISFNSERAINQEIVRHFTVFMNNLYNKIFRTKLLSTTIFQDPSFRIFSGNYGYNNFGNHAYYAEMVKIIERSPYLLPIETRFLIFKQKIREWSSNEPHEYGQNKIKIHRGHEFKDAFDQLYNSNMRKKLYIHFINEYNQEEIGIDGGGLTKQFLTRVFKQAFSPKFGRFIENNQKELMPNPEFQNIQEGKIAKEYEFIGRLLGKSLLENIMLGMKFAGPFLNLLLNKKNTFDQLLQIDPQLYKSLIFITEMQQGIEQLQLTFQYQDNITKTTKNLMLNGHKIKVSKHNKMEYINLLINYKVNKSFERQTNYIRKGLKGMINETFFKVFNYAEFNYLLSGEGKIDVGDWKMHTKVYGEDCKELLVEFWEIVLQFSEEEKSLLLKFVTSCERPSFLGFKDLQPPFTIRVLEQKTDSLPLSHTCMNLLDLPHYKSKQLMRQKILYAIKSQSGFQMS